MLCIKQYNRDGRRPAACPRDPERENGDLHNNAIFCNDGFISLKYLKQTIRIKR